MLTRRRRPTKHLHRPPAAGPQTIYGTAYNGWTNPGYTTADARFGWNDACGREDLPLSFAVTNLGDKVYRTQGCLRISGASYSLPGEPRLWYFGARYHF
jgi:outer membrane receptor protein involved in Fe transport